MRSILFSLLFCHAVVAFMPNRYSKIHIQTQTKQFVSTDNSILSESDVANNKPEGSMMSSPAFKIIDFIMSIPIIHGWY